MSKKVYFNGACVCAYQAVLELPDDIDEKNELAVSAYINEHIDELTRLNGYEYLGEDFPVTEEDIWKITV